MVIESADSIIVSNDFLCQVTERFKRGDGRGADWQIFWATKQIVGPRWEKASARSARDALDTGFVRRVVRTGLEPTALRLRSERPPLTPFSRARKPHRNNVIWPPRLVSSCSARMCRLMLHFLMTTEILIRMELIQDSPSRTPDE